MIMEEKSKNCPKIYTIFFSISSYATASTDESVFIIGGFIGPTAPWKPAFTSTIAEYKDGNWEKVGDLAQARYSHGAITSESVTMILGGYPNDVYEP